MTTVRLCGFLPYVEREEIEVIQAEHYTFETQSTLLKRKLKTASSFSGAF